MKKQLFLMAVVALAMASCSKDDSTRINKGSAIDFRVALGTRAAETTTGNLASIFVTAIDKNNANLFSDEKFSKNEQYFTCLLYTSPSPRDTR